MYFNLIILALVAASKRAESNTSSFNRTQGCFSQLFIVHQSIHYLYNEISKVLHYMYLDRMAFLKNIYKCGDRYLKDALYTRRKWKQSMIFCHTLVCQSLM